MINTHMSPSIVDNYHSPVINSTSRSCKPRFAQETSSIFTQFIQLNKTKSYVSITGCVLEYILHCPILTNNEKLFYLIADSLSLINGKNATKKRSVALPATKWAEKINCSKNEIFTMQKSLEAKGYFIVVRDKNEFGKNQRNLITPSLPDTVFHYLSKAPNKLNHEVRDDSSVTSLTSSLAFSHCINIEKNTIEENKRVYLDKTKLFIQLNYQLLLLIASSDQLNSFAKVLWLDFYTKCYKYHMKLKNTDTSNYNNNFTCTTSYKELETKYSCSKSTLSKTMNVLEKLGFIDKKRFHVKNDNKDDNLHDKSLWNITLSLPQELALNILNLKPRLEYDYQANPKTNISCTDPYVVNFGQFLNKDPELNNKDLFLNFKDPDNIDKQKNFFENFNRTSVSSELSESYKNSFSFKEKSNSNIKSQTTDLKISNNKDITQTISLEEHKKQDKEVATTLSDISISVELPNHIDTQTATTIQPSSTNNLEITKTNNKALTQPKPSDQSKPLKAFYPLSKEQVDKLNCLSGRKFGGFSVNFANQLLLKLSRDPNKLFLSKNHMMSYMSKAFRYEKHQAPLVNHESFRFTANVSDPESIEERQREKYLSEVEYSIDTSHLSRLRRKIASVLEPKLAYRLLTEVEYKFEYQAKEESQNQQYSPILQQAQQVQQHGQKQEEGSKEFNEFLKLLSYTNNTECLIQLPEDLALTYLQEEILEKAITSVYGNDIDINYEKIATKNWSINKKSQINSLSEINLEDLDTNSVWYKIRKKMKTQLHHGEYLDKAWFSKLTAEEDKTTNTLTLYAPSNFIRDYVNHNYASIVRQIAKELGYQFVELVAKLFV